ncbi:MAG: TldD/PmbA family protein, partial [Acetatifactor sp.]|nr:TldD/PmbA family protein [Acetatifactor sp.]
MQAAFSPYLESIADGIKKLIAILQEDYDYVSVLSTDSPGFAMRFTTRDTVVSESTLITERGNVVRVRKDGLYSEYAFNEFDPEHPEETAEEVKTILSRQLEVLKATGSKVYETEKLSDDPCVLRKEFETQELPETADIPKIIDMFTGMVHKAKEMEERVVECQASAQSTHVSKMFLTANRDLRQSYVASECMIAPIVSDGEKTEYGYVGLSGRKGPELFSELPQKLEKAMKASLDNLAATPVEPGEYEIIAAPEVAGLIAHEAFGHGVEMDMFVKNRALGKQYIGKRVGSDLVTMHEGADAAVDVASYAFDDEGTLAGDVIEIQNGILNTGVCDALAAARLGTRPTGNGKRQNFEHKVYTRMTNTVFEAGDSTLDEMIASVKFGYLIEGGGSGMEDPKHWGIQCIVQRGYEIVDGKLTGKIVGPLIITGYVPELLGGISMLSNEVKVFGTGACGKG